MTSDKILIGLVGRKGSGKGAVADIIKQRYGGEIFWFSGLLRDVIDRLSLERTHDHLIKMSETLRHTFGEDILTRGIIGDIQKSDAHLVILDCLRRNEDIMGLDKIGNLKIIFVDASPEIRFARFAGRKEKANEHHMTWEEFLQLEQRSTETTIANVAAQAWKTIKNEGSLDELIKQIDGVMRELEVKPHSS